ncbi:MAG: nucleotidyltransferase domain-containing protein [Spirochaetia bacterium]|nr:nucleotidyltransferase domain-containing protein [Spirochaetia bacterium]
MQSKISFQSIVLERILRSDVEKSAIVGVLIFGSRARGDHGEVSDVDLGVVFSGEEPVIDSQSDWDLFLWSKERWESGFALQIELARSAEVLYDPHGVIAAKLDSIRSHILPHWEIHLKQF